jgi:hypothetical protein
MPGGRDDAADTEVNALTLEPLHHRTIVIDRAIHQVAHGNGAAALHEMVVDVHPAVDLAEHQHYGVFSPVDAAHDVEVLSAVLTGTIRVDQVVGCGRPNVMDYSPRTIPEGPGVAVADDVDQGFPEEPASGKPQLLLDPATEYPQVAPGSKLQDIEDAPFAGKLHRYPYAFFKAGEYCKAYLYPS